MDVVSQPLSGKWFIMLSCIILAFLYPYAACGAKGIAEDVHFNSKFDCKTSSKRVLRVSSELQCLHKCAFKKCKFFNYKDAPTESQSANENCEIYWGTKNESSCSTLVKIDGWKAVFYQNLEALRKPKAEETFSSNCENTCASDVSTTTTCGQDTFVIQHYNGLCLSLRLSDSRFRLNSSCNEKFAFTASKALKHIPSGKCVIPTAPSDNARIILTSDCCDVNSHFSQTAGLSMMHTQSGKCVHPYGGNEKPSPDTEIVLASGCNEKRLQFKLDDGNIARLKPTSQSSLHSYQGIELISSFGNDGNIYGDFRVCAFTQADASPWWQVDLTREAVVGKVAVKSGTTWGQDHTDNFYLSVGNVASNGGKSNSLCVDRGRLHGEEKLFVCPTPLRGRYVSIYLTRSEFLQVCEVSVYQAPFIIKHFSGLCVSLRTSNCRFRLHSNCNETFILTESNSLRHLESGKCMIPMGLADNSRITLTSNCCDVNSHFTQTSSFSMKHNQTTKCVHPLGGRINPAVDTDIVIYGGCNVDQLKFEYVYVF